MNGLPDALAILHELTAEDRAWLIAQLPAQARSRLLGATSNETSNETSHREVAHKDQTPLDALTNIDVVALARVLKHEPAWVAVALLDARQWSWEARLLEALPPVMRAQVADVRRVGCKFTSLLIHEIARLVLRRLAHGGDVRHGHGPSRFEALVTRLSAARSKRRLTIHL